MYTQSGSVGATIIHQIEQADCPFSMVVCGSRGLGTIKRAMLSAIGLGSTSDHLCHHLNVPVVVVRQGQGHEAPQQASDKSA